VIIFSPTVWGGTIQLPAPDPYPELPNIVNDVTLVGLVTIDGGVNRPVCTSSGYPPATVNSPSSG